MVATELKVGNWYYKVFYQDSTDTAVVVTAKYVGRKHSWKTFEYNDGHRFTTQSTDWHEDVGSAIYSAIGTSAADYVIACSNRRPKDMCEKRLARLIRMCWMLDH